MATYEPLFYEAGVDVVFSGHTHAYERSTPVFNRTGVPARCPALRVVAATAAAAAAAACAPLRATGCCTTLHQPQWMSAGPGT